MKLIVEFTFALALLLNGLVATVNPAGVRSFYIKFGARSPFSERTVEWSIRSGGVIALLMAAFVFWALVYGQ
jgi:hypothetical protein